MKYDFYTELQNSFGSKWLTHEQCLMLQKALNLAPGGCKVDSDQTCKDFDGGKLFIADNSLRLLQPNRTAMYDKTSGEFSISYLADDKSFFRCSLGDDGKVVVGYYDSESYSYLAGGKNSAIDTISYGYSNLGIVPDEEVEYDLDDNINFFVFANVCEMEKDDFFGWMATIKRNGKSK